MKAKDLRLEDLLQYQPDSGIIRLLDYRILIFDSLALGLLHKELIESMGLHGARAVLSRFGFAHGWRTAESLKHDWPELFLHDGNTGPRLHTMHGLLTHLNMERTKDENGNLLIIAEWKDSYEVEQHQLHSDIADEPVCWTICAFASGYVSNRLGREIFFIEQQCCAKGDPVCRVEARFPEHWGPAYADQLRYFNKNAADTFLLDISKKLKVLDKRLRHRKKQIIRAENEALYNEFSARSPAMRKVIDLARRIASVDSSVVISGDSGVGKERIARLIHEYSPRANKPFVAINCGALTETLLESELFGYAKGSFTGANSDRTGLLEAAKGGTLFLDEVSEMPLSMQVKLLRVLQEHEIRRIGEVTTRPIDIHILSATNCNLAEEVAEGRFRQDLYYRLRVIELKIPSIRDRVEDIIPIAQSYLDSIIQSSGRKPTTLSPAVAKAMLHYDWPGNVREIQNTVEYALALTNGEQITLDDLPEDLLQIQLKTPANVVRPLAEIESDYIKSVLNRMDGNKAKTARALNIGIATLYRKLKEANL